MALIAQEATYRGEIVDAGLSESSGGFPQEVLKLKSAEVYDDESKEWLPADPENNEITYYGVLFDGKNKETLNCKQLKKIIGWDGASFDVLAGSDLAGVPIQFRVEPRTYQENTTLQVTWIDVYDAVPGRTVQKLDKEGVAALQRKYATILAATKTPAKAVSAPVSAPASAPTASVSPPAAPPQAKRGRPKGKPTVPVKAPAVAPAAPAVATGGKCTPDEAWDACVSLKKDEITEEKLTEVWSLEVYKFNDDPNKLTPEQWYRVKEAVQKLTSKV